MQSPSHGLLGFILKCALLLSSIQGSASTLSTGTSAPVPGGCRQSTCTSAPVPGGCRQHRVVDPGNWASSGLGLPGTYLLVREDAAPPKESCFDGCVYENTDVISDKLYCFGEAIKFMDPTQHHDAVNTEEALINSMSRSMLQDLGSVLTGDEMTHLAAELGASRPLQQLDTIIQTGNCEERQQLDSSLQRILLGKPEDYTPPSCENDHIVLASIKKTLLVRINEGKDQPTSTI